MKIKTTFSNKYINKLCQEIKDWPDNIKCKDKKCIEDIDKNANCREFISFLNKMKGLVDKGILKGDEEGYYIEYKCTEEEYKEIKKNNFGL